MGGQIGELSTLYVQTTTYMPICNSKIIIIIMIPIITPYCFSLHFCLILHRLIGLVHELPKSETEVLQRCAHFFKVLSQPLSAATVYEKLGDNTAVVALYVESKQWDMVG